MTVLRIRDWEKHFENNRTSEIRKLTWVPFPNKHDGEGYSILVTGHENGAAHYGAWCVIVQIASKCSPRGTLIRDDGTPHTPQSLAAKSRLPAVILQEAAARLLEIKWLEAIELPDNDLQTTPQDAAAAPQDAAARARAREGKGREGKGREGEKPQPPVGANFGSEFKRVVAARDDWNGTIPDYESYRTAHHSRGIPPDRVIDELVPLVKSEPAHRWEKYGFAKCIGYILDDIAKRFERVGNQNTRQTMSDIVGDSEENIRKALS